MIASPLHTVPRWPYTINQLSQQAQDLIAIYPMFRPPGTVILDEGPYKIDIALPFGPGSHVHQDQSPGGCLYGSWGVLPADTFAKFSGRNEATVTIWCQRVIGPARCGPPVTFSDYGGETHYPFDYANYMSTWLSGGRNGFGDIGIGFNDWHLFSARTSMLRGLVQHIQNRTVVYNGGPASPLSTFTFNHIGWSGVGFAEYQAFYGYIGEIRIYNRWLEDDELEAIRDLGYRNEVWHELGRQSVFYTPPATKKKIVHSPHKFKELAATDPTAPVRDRLLAWNPLVHPYNYGWGEGPFGDQIPTNAGYFKQGQDNSLRMLPENGNASSVIQANYPPTYGGYAITFWLRVYGWDTQAAGYYYHRIHLYTTHAAGGTYAQHVGFSGFPAGIMTPQRFIVLPFHGDNPPIVFNQYPMLHDEWMHVAIQVMYPYGYAPGTSKLWINGESLGTASNGINRDAYPPDTVGRAIGNHGFGQNSPIGDYAIKDFREYHSLLSDTEARDIYQHSKAFHEATSDLIRTNIRPVQVAIGQFIQLDDGLLVLSSSAPRIIAGPITVEMLAGVLEIESHLAAIKAGRITVKLASDILKIESQLGRVVSGPVSVKLLSKLLEIKSQLITVHKGPVTVRFSPVELEVDSHLAAIKSGPIRVHLLDADITIESEGIGVISGPLSIQLANAILKLISHPMAVRAGVIGEGRRYFILREDRVFRIIAERNIYDEGEEE